MASFASRLAASFHRVVVRYPKLDALAKNLGEKQAEAAGWRRLGLRYDDIIMEEDKAVQEALRRLPKKEIYDRNFRIKRAHQCVMLHDELPVEDQLTREEDVRYFSPLIQQVEFEMEERKELENLAVRPLN